MQKSTSEFIQTLTKADTKTLTGKALKVAEEAGELASVVLPYENAAGTIHRFIAKRDILEEVADVYLTSISIAYDLGYTDADIEEMVERKMEKWADLQHRESKITFPIPYEIHITVKNESPERIWVNDFGDICEELGVKPITIQLQLEGAKYSTDVMTSSKHYGDNKSAYEEMKRISDGLKHCCFEVIREKIETVPWHPAAPSNERGNHRMPRGCYFESHIAVVVGQDKSVYSVALPHIAKEYSSHISKNPFKILDDGNYIQMITYRTYNDVYEDFKEHCANLRNELKYSGYSIENMVTEYSIFDTENHHDEAWIKADVGN